MTIIATAADQHRFSEATLYTVTYPGAVEMDMDVRWPYVERAARRMGGDIVCRDKDGTSAGRRRVSK